MRDAHFKNSSGRVRTDDLQVNSLSLSQLSYRGTVLST